MSGVQTLVVKSGQDVSCGVEGLTVMRKESPIGASAVNTAIEKSVSEMQSTTSAIVANAEWVHDTV